MATKTSGVDLIIEDLVDIMLEIEGGQDSGQGRKAIESLQSFTHRVAHGMSLLVAQPIFAPFFASGIRDAKDDETTLQERLPLTNQQMSDMYEYGISLYSEGKYSAASDVLMCMCMLNPFIAGFWRALGLSQEAEGDYSGAVLSYAVALEKDDDLAPALFTARCLGQLGHRMEALEALDQATTLAQQASANQEFFIQAKAIRAGLA